MKKRYYRPSALIIVALFFCANCFFSVKTFVKADRAVEINDNYIASEIIVKYRYERINLQNNLGRLKAQVLNSSKSLREKDRIQSQNASLLTIEDGQTVAEKIAELQNDPSVEYAEPNYRRSQMVISTNDPSRGLLWGLDNTGQTVNGTAGTADADIDIPEAWAINEGTNATVTVAVIDTGVDYNHPDLADNMWDGSTCKDEDGNALGGCLHGYDYYEGYEAGGDNDPMPGAETGFYHGTHVAGTIGAVKNNSVGLVGVAPNVKIMALKFGFETFSEVKAIDFARQNGAKVINASYGGTGYTSLEYNAINAFRTAGGIFVAAAGNNGDSYQPAGWNNDTESTHIYPSDYNLDNIISVAAVDQNDNLTAFSNYGATSVDVAAPGTNIYSTYPGNAYAYSNGTSMATPHVAGLVALVWGYRPDLEYSQVRSILLTSGDDKASLSGKTTTGKRINAQNSLASDIGELHHINISPNTTQNITSGQTVTFTAQGQDVDNNNIAGLSYTWTGTSASNSGLFNNLTPGAYQVRASSGGIDSATVTVNVEFLVLGSYELGGVFYIENGIKRPIKNESVFQNWGFEWSDVTWVSASMLNSYQTGDSLTQLAQYNGAVYLVQGGIFRPINDADTFNIFKDNWGLGWGDIRPITASVFGYFPKGDKIFFPRLVTYSTGGTVYRMDNDGKRPIDSADTFNEWGFNWGSIFYTKNDSFLKSYPSPAPLSILALNNGGVYLIDNGTKRPITSPEAFNNLAATDPRVRWDKVYQVSDGLLSVVSLGEAI